MKTKVLVDGSSYHVFKHDGILDELPKGVYEFRFGPQGQVSLERQPDITLPKKIYSNDKDFISHVMKTYKNLSRGLLGVGLVGGKGLGKSFTATLLCHLIDTPVIKLTKSVGSTSFLDYLKQINQDYILYIDEFEKLFPDTHDNEDQRASQEQLLSFLDGGSPFNNKIMFIITSNNQYGISDYIKNRPSRLRYFRKYDKMDDIVIKEVVEDLLINKNHLQDLLDNVPYDVINLDALIKIVEEVNIHNKPYSEFKNFFNFQDKKDLEVKIDLVLPDGKLTPLANRVIREIYPGQKVGMTKSLQLFKKKPSTNSVTIFLNFEEETISETPLEPIKKMAFYKQFPGKDTSVQPEIVSCEILISPVINTLANNYVM